ncbi:phage tail tube protein [Microbacterium sp. GXF6406]
MTIEAVAPGVVTDGTGLVLFVPAIADVNAPTVEELTATGVKKLTYSLTPDGFAHETTVATSTSGRFTLEQALEQEGTITDSVEITYVTTEDDEQDIARVALERGTTGFIVKRIAVSNALDIAADQRVTVLPIRAGVQRDVAPAANEEWKIIQKLLVTGVVGRKVKVVA